MKKALEDGRFRLPDNDELQADLVSCGYKYRSDGKLLLESKDDMRRRGVPFAGSRRCRGALFQRTGWLSAGGMGGISIVI